MNVGHPWSEHGSNLTGDILRSKCVPCGAMGGDLLQTIPGRWIIRKVQRKVHEMVTQNECGSWTGDLV